MWESPGNGLPGLSCAWMQSERASGCRGYFLVFATAVCPPGPGCFRGNASRTRRSEARVRGYLRFSDIRSFGFRHWEKSVPPESLPSF